MFGRLKPNLIILLLGIFFVAVVDQMYAQNVNRGMEEFGLGRNVAAYLVKGCVIFAGTIQAVGEPEKEAGVDDDTRAMLTRRIDIRVDEWIYGEHRGGENIRLVYAARPIFTKTSLGPWSAWGGVDPSDLQVGRRLFVIRWAEQASRPTWLGKPQDIALVLPGKNLFASIRNIVATHTQLKQSPEEVEKALQLLREKKDPIFAGYLVTYLMEGESLRNVNEAATHLRSLLGNQHIPEPAWKDIADWFVSNFYRLSDETRKSVTETLVVAASSEDKKLAESGIAALIRLGDGKLLEMRPFLTPDRRGKLGENYRLFLSRGRAGRGQADFESQLGIEISK